MASCKTMHIVGCHFSGKRKEQMPHQAVYRLGDHIPYLLTALSVRMGHVPGRLGLTYILTILWQTCHWVMKNSRINKSKLSLKTKKKVTDERRCSLSVGIRIRASVTVLIPLLIVMTVPQSSHSVLNQMHNTLATTRCLQNIESFQVCLDPEETEGIIWSSIFIDEEKEVIPCLCPPLSPTSVLPVSIPFRDSILELLAQE